MSDEMYLSEPKRLTEVLKDMVDNEDYEESKYCVFKREDLISVTDEYMTFSSRVRVQDAVVIRRQDKFASPCLATYAAMIALVAMEHPNVKRRAELLVIADYFEHQAKLAAEEGHKLPDL